MVRHFTNYVVSSIVNLLEGVRGGGRWEVKSEGTAPVKTAGSIPTHLGY